MNDIIIIAPMELKHKLKLFAVLAPIVAIALTLAIEYVSGKGSKTGGTGP